MLQLSCSFQFLIVISINVGRRHCCHLHYWFRAIIAFLGLGLSIRQALCSNCGRRSDHHFSWIVQYVAGFVPRLLYSTRSILLHSLVSLFVITSCAGAENLLSENLTKYALMGATVERLGPRVSDGSNGGLGASAGHGARAFYFIFASAGVGDGVRGNERGSGIKLVEVL